MFQASNTFKLRYNGHTDSFINEWKEKDTTLSKYLWDLKRKEMESEVKWSIASLAIPYTRESKRCQLCNMEKTLISRQDQAIALNRRGEIMTRCRHRDKDLLANWVYEWTASPPLVPTEPDPKQRVEPQPLPPVDDDLRDAVPHENGRLEGGGPETRAMASGQGKKERVRLRGTGYKNDISNTII